MEKLSGGLFVEDMTSAERVRAERVETVLPALREAAAAADANGEFYLPHIKTLREAGLLGMIVPETYGGLGGGLRDLAATTFAMATACPSTALAYFFHCSSASRGLLPLEAIEAGLFSAEEIPKVRDFAEKVLTKMGREGLWLANFASESVKSSTSAVFISTTATPTAGGWLLNGIKSFGCATGVANEYLVTAKIAGIDSADGIALFFVGRAAEGISERQKWDALGMRATATHGIILKDVFVKDTDALAIPGAFVRMLQMSRGSFVGNQLAGIACYLGAAQRVYDYALEFTTNMKFRDTGKAIATSPFHQELLGKMTVDLETAYLWLRRQLELETADPPILPKQRVVLQWRMCKGEVCEAAERIALNALKACGTSNTGNSGVIARSVRDITMGLVQAFPAERGRLEAAKMVVEAKEQT
ncbi:MAG: acyl-CoA dehydrogenase family protein, partial [Anaerolineales bacterium]|nr:acyl-CoA dehydrogenase family protein [Anaerolineales bacterium]